MQHLANSLPSSASALTAMPPNVETPKLPLPATSTRTLWLRMAEIYGHRWTAAYGESAEEGAGGTWSKGLAGLSVQQIGAGIGACIASADPWPPTLPEFRAKCLGIPPLAAVRLDTDKADPFTVLVWQNLDGYRYRQASADQSDRMLREAYELAREHVMRGGELPAVAERRVAHEKPTPRPASKAVAEAAIAEIRAELGA